MVRWGEETGQQFNYQKTDSAYTLLPRLSRLEPLTLSWAILHTWAAAPPGRGPGGLPRLGGLPQRKVPRVALFARRKVRLAVARQLVRRRRRARAELAVLVPRRPAGRLTLNQINQACAVCCQISMLPASSSANVGELGLSLRYWWPAALQAEVHRGHPVHVTLGPVHAIVRHRIAPRQQGQLADGKPMSCMPNRKI